LSVVFVAGCAIFDYDSVKNINDNPIVQGLLGFSLELFIVIVLGVSLILVKTLTATEFERIDASQITAAGKTVREVTPALTAFLGGKKVEFRFDHMAFYEMPKMLDVSYRWAEFDRDEFFLVKAGSLDKPKLTLRSITHEAGKLVFHLGASSFYDIFFTHYSPDLKFSSQRANESAEEDANSVRGILKKSLDRYYASDLKDEINKEVFTLFDFIPNSLGLSGIVVLECEDGKIYVPLRVRQMHEAASQDELEWSFAGLLEASDWLHATKIDIDELIDIEFIDEFLHRFDAVKYSVPRSSFSSEIIGMTLNPLFLYQPEIYALLITKNVPKEVIECLRDQFDEKQHRLVEVTDLERIARTEKTKNLFDPGLLLFREARAKYFEDCDPA
jgi:hypothetical protein